MVEREKSIQTNMQYSRHLDSSFIGITFTVLKPIIDVLGIVAPTRFVANKLEKIP